VIEQVRGRNKQTYQDVQANRSKDYSNKQEHCVNMSQMSRHLLSAIMMLVIERIRSRENLNFLLFLCVCLFLFLV
jgi:hypothetical protein